MVRVFTLPLIRLQQQLSHFFVLGDMLPVFCFTAYLLLIRLADLTHNSLSYQSIRFYLSMTRFSQT